MQFGTYFISFGTAVIASDPRYFYFCLHNLRPLSDLSFRYSLPFLIHILLIRIPIQYLCQPISLESIILFIPREENAVTLRDRFRFEVVPPTVFSVTVRWSNPKIS